MTKCLSVLLLACLAFPSGSEASMKFISTHHSKIFNGDSARKDCEREADRVFAEFPVEAATSAGISLIDVICEPVGEKRARLSIVHEHSIADEISTIAERTESAAVCMGSLASVREAFSGAGLAPVSAYCEGADVFVDFIDPLRVSHDRYSHGPRFTTRAECGARYLRLASDFEVAGFMPLVGACQEYKDLLDNKPYFVTSFVYAMPLGLHLSVLHGRSTRSLSECLGDFSGIRARFSAAGLPVVDTYCADDIKGFHQVVSYADTLIGKLKTHDGPVQTDAERCERTRERVGTALVNQGNEILHSYCEELRPFTAEPKGFRYRIHYIEIKEEE